MKGNLCRCTGYRAIRESITQSVLGPVRETGPVAVATLRDRAASARRDRTASAERPSARRQQVVQGLEPYTFDTTVPGGADAAGARPARTRTRASSRSTRPRPRRWTGSSPSSPTATRPRGATRPHGTSTRPTTPTTPGCSTTSCATSASASRRSSPRRPRPPSRRAGLIRVDYEILPAVFDPELARSPGRPGDPPGPHARTTGWSEAGRNVIAVDPRRLRRRRGGPRGERGIRQRRVAHRRG